MPALSCFKSFEEVVGDDKGKVQGNSLFPLSQSQEVNIYKGAPVGEPFRGDSRGALRRKVKRDVPLIDMHPVEFLLDHEIDKRIKEDEEKEFISRDKGNHSLSIVKKEGLSSNSHMGKRGARNYRGKCSYSSSQGEEKLVCGKTNVQSLSNAPIDGITAALDTESALLDEFEYQKRADFLRHIAASIFSTDDSTEEEPFKRGDRDGEELKALKREAKILLDKDARARQISERLKERLGIKQNNILIPRCTPESLGESFSNSSIPGPYLTLHQKGDFTRFEALTKRNKISLFPALTFENKKESHAIDNQSPKNRTFLPPTSKVEKTVDFSMRDENGDSERLRRWKYKMGLLY